MKSLLVIGLTDMARIRSVHPGLFTDEAFMELSPHAQLFSIGLWTEADDQGVFAWKPRTLKARILPATMVDASDLLAELVAAGAIQQFEADGTLYGAVRNFRRFQRPEKPKAYHPLPDELRDYVGLSSNNHSGSEKPCPPLGGSSGNGSRQVADKEDSSPRPVADQSPTATCFAGQMEDGGGRREEKKERMPDSVPEVGRERDRSDPSGGAETPVEPIKRARSRKADRDEPAGFAEFYQAYPRHEGRAKAAEVFPAAVKVAGSVEALMDFLRGFRFGPDPQFHPHPATWLNQRRWRDGQGITEAPAPDASQDRFDRRYFDRDPAEVAKLPKPEEVGPEYNAWWDAVQGLGTAYPGTRSGANAI
jgi:hypothetical protein